MVSQEKTSGSFTKAFYAILECPVCKDYMSPPPIMQCVNGHNVCAKCKVKLNDCPVCRNGFSQVRNISLEHIIELVKFPCTNSDAGCDEEMSLDEKLKHEKLCPRRVYECLPGKFVGCNWKGRRQNILEHVEEKHNTKAWMKDSKLNIAHPNLDFGKDSDDYQIINTENELFWFQTLMKSSEETFYVSIHYIGEKENSSKYFYKITCDAGHKPQYNIGLCTDVHHDYESIEDLAITKKCFHISKEVANKFTTDNSLKYTLEIIKEN